MPELCLVVALAARFAPIVSIRRIYVVLRKLTVPPALPLISFK